MQELAGGPPAPWQLTETPDDTHMTLSKSYNNEELRVDITVNEQVSPRAEDVENNTRHTECCT